MDGFPNMDAAKARAAESSEAAARAERQHDDVVSARLPLISASQIPPRGWAYGHFLLFGSAAVIGAIDGGGKGAIAVAIMLAMITGKPLLGETVWRSGPVAIITYEDDTVEWHRRIAAACKHYALDYAMVLGNIRFIHRTGGRITFGRRGEYGIEFPDHDGILKELAAFRPVLLIIDPFNHAHDLEDGNSNVLMAQVAGEMARIAQEAECAVLVLHHLRKGSNGNLDDLMGATSLRATFRSCRILARMTPEMAKQMNITDPWRYIGLASSKDNYAPPPEHGTWFRLTSVALENGAGIYPDGDEMAVAVNWTPRGLFAGMEATQLREVFASLRKGVWGPSKQGRHARWAGFALVENGGRTDREATQIVKQWLDSGVLIQSGQYHAESKHTVQRVNLNEALVTKILADIGIYETCG